jgi:radical SAM protein with 4Fe4S-binding SPASM domain
MPIDEHWLGRGWYARESSDDHEWIWSTDIAEIYPQGCDRIDLKLFTTYSEFTSSLQEVTVLVDGSAQSTHYWCSGAHELSIHPNGARSIFLKVDPFTPARFKRSNDSRVLGVALYDLLPLNLPRQPLEPVRKRLNVQPNGPPFTIQVEISTACHLSCIMCSRPKKTGGSPEHMKPGTWDRFFEMARSAETVNILGTGEPWTHPRFLDYLRQLDDAGVSTMITTSGDLITDERAKALGELRHLKEVTFSLDSPDPDVYYRIRGQPLSRALAGLQRTAAAIRNPGALRIHTVVMKDTLPSLSVLPALLRDYSVKALALRGVNQTTEATRNMVPDYTVDERAALLRIRDEAEAQGATVNLLPTLPSDVIQIRTADFNDERGSDSEASLWNRPVDPGVPRTRICFDPWEKAIVTRDGEIYPCEAYHLQQSLGSIATQSFAEVWFGDEYAKFRRRFLDGENVGCRSCERRGWGQHPFNLVAAEIVTSTIVLGGESEIRLRNSGIQAWSDDYPVCLGTARPRDRMCSSFAHPTWIAPNRVATHDRRTIAPGEVATFRFRLTTPTEGKAIEHFCFVMENYCWIPGTELQICAGPTA